MIASASSPLGSSLTPVGAIFAALGLVFLLVGVAISVSGRRLGRHAEWAEGKIIGMDATDSNAGGVRIGGGIGADTAQSGDPASASTAFLGGGLIYRPTVEFTTRDGSAVRATSPIGSNPRPGRVGDTVRVRYDPQNPQRFRVDSLRGRGTCLEVAFILIGAAFTLLGVGVLVLAGQ